MATLTLSFSGETLRDLKREIATYLAAFEANKLNDKETPAVEDDGPEFAASPLPEDDMFDAVPPPAAKKKAGRPAKPKEEQIAKAYTIDEVRAACMAHAAKHSRAETDALLSKIGGAKKLNLIDAGKFGALMKALK